MTARVLPATPRRIVLSSLGLAALGSTLWLRIAERVGTGVPEAARYVFGATAIALFLLWTFVLEASVPRMRTLLACAAANGIGCALVLSTYWGMAPRAISLRALLVETGLECVAFAGASVLTMAALRACRRALLGRTLEQDGTMCWGCAYPREGTKDAQCPECSTAWDLGHPPGSMWRRLPALAALGRRGGAVLIGVVLLIAALDWPRADVAVRSNEFLLRMAERGGTPVSGLMVLDPPAIAPARMYPGAILAIEPTTGLSLWITYDAEARGDDPAMLVRCVYYRAGPGSTGAAPSVPGGTIMNTRPELYCELTAAQAEVVIKKGLPAGLVEGFKELIARSGAIGIARIAQADQQMRIDPAPFFGEWDR